MAVPETHGLVVTAGSDRFAVRGERETEHPTGVAPERFAFLPCACVPELDRLVVAGRGKCLAVRGELDGGDGVVVPRQFRHGLVLAPVHNEYGFPFSRRGE